MSPERRNQNPRTFFSSKNSLSLSLVSLKIEIKTPDSFSAPKTVSLVSLKWQRQWRKTTPSKTIRSLPCLRMISWEPLVLSTTRFESLGYKSQPFLLSIPLSIDFSFLGFSFLFLSKEEFQRTNLELESFKEKIKENQEKIKLNKQLPYLVGNIVEVSNPFPFPILLQFNFFCYWFLDLKLLHLISLECLNFGAWGLCFIHEFVYRVVSC